MANASAKIGALHVSLGLDTAQFQSNLDNVTNGLGRFKTAAVVGFAAVTAAAAAATVALSVAIRGAVNHADELGKAAQKAGTTVAALSRLEYAAALSDVSLNSLTTGLTKLSVNMATVATEASGPAASAFAALGIAVQGVGGKLRSSDEVLTDVADRFSRMEDGATKTALAVGIFGKSGAQLIPLLNEGRDGLAAFAAEADQLGITIGTDTAAAAEDLNDTFTRLEWVTKGITNQVMVAAMPAMKTLAETLASPAITTAATNFAAAAVSVLNGVIQIAAGVVNALTEVGKAFNKLPMSGEAASLTADDLQKQIDQANAIINNPNSNSVAVERSTDWRDNLLAEQRLRESGESTGPGEPPPFTPPDIKPYIADLGALKEGQDAATEAAKALNEQLEFAGNIFDATRTPFERMQEDLKELDAVLAKSGKNWETYARAAGNSIAGAAEATLGSLANLSAGLSGAFKDNQALAIATAVLKGAEAVASAYAAGNAVFGPWGGAAYAAVAAITAAANVAAVASVGPTSTSMSGSSSAATPPELPDTSVGTAINLTFKGGGRYSRDEIEDMFRAINEGLGDGIRLNVNGA